MKTIVTAALLMFGTAAMSATSASADSLYELGSACRTGDFTACSQYNAAIIARNSAQQPVLTQGYDPFAIVPATHAARTPVAATNGPATSETDVTAVVVTVSQ